MASLRRSLQRFAEDLQLFSGQLAQETQELKRNVELKPITGATNYRHCLEDVNDRLAAVGEELAALEAVSLDAISLEVRCPRRAARLLTLPPSAAPTPPLRRLRPCPRRSWWGTVLRCTS